MRRLFEAVCIATCLTVTAFVLGCANQMAPGGGPQDVDPPFVLWSDPPNFSTQFDKSQIRLTFNEFVKLKQASQQVLISPPMKKNPDFSLKGKSVIINLQEDLLPNTTYSIFFGNAIVDITEENPLANFLYVFSTGDYVDSLSIAGEVVNAFTLKPEENIFVMLFSLSNDTVPVDSLPVKVRPLYVAKTNKEGQFRLQYLRNEPMKLFALKDMNSNYLFDIPEEEIAFEELPITPEIPKNIETDTAAQIFADSVKVSEMYDTFYRLRLFHQKDSTQRRLTADGIYPPGFLLTYRYGLKAPSFSLLDSTVTGPWFINELNQGRDSLRVWITQPVPDSLKIRVIDGEIFADTVQVVLPEKKPAETSRRRGAEESKPERLFISSTVKARLLELHTPLNLKFDHPVIRSDNSGIALFTENDTLTGLNFIPTDSIGRIWKPDFDLEEETLYNLVIPDSTFFNIYEQTNDSTIIAFRTRKTSDYGNLYITMQLPGEPYPYILQLLNSKDKVVREVIITQPGEVSLLLLDPAIYRLKAIRDKHTNGRWDTGVYFDKRQPEDVFFFPKELQVRANWDIEEVWTIE